MTVDLLLRRSEAREAGLQTGRDLIGTRKKREKFTFTWSPPLSLSLSLSLFALQSACWTMFNVACVLFATYPNGIAALR